MIESSGLISIALEPSRMASSLRPDSANVTA
jgi:hypothetical protein